MNTVLLAKACTEFAVPFMNDANGFSLNAGLHGNYLVNIPKNINHFFITEDSNCLMGMETTKDYINNSKCFSNTKYCLAIDSYGKFHIMDTTVGRKRALNMLLKAFEVSVMNPIEQTVFITYDTDVTEALKLGERLKAIYGVGEVRIVKSGSNIKRLLGENVLGLFFTGKERS